MRSTSGEYYLRLDQLRALAAYLVFMWHFLHGVNGIPVAFHVEPLPPFSIIDEGHLGVSLFMSLSGFLFVRLLQNRKVFYLGFIWNRILRLLPLLLLVLLIGWLRLNVNNAEEVVKINYLNSIAQGWRLPSLPNGGWSITVEFHYYLVLPILLYAIARYGVRVLAFLLFLSIGVRAYLFVNDGTVQLLSYLTLVGRIDQFLLGMLAAIVARRHPVPRWLMVFGVLIFTLIYQLFDHCGGFYDCGDFPSKSQLWIFLPTIEGLFFALLISWFDAQKIENPSSWARCIAHAGQWSYGLYLLHPFWVFGVASWLYLKLGWISNFYAALLVGTGVYLLSLPIAWLSWRFVESPFLKLRVNYVRH